MIYLNRQCLTEIKFRQSTCKYSWLREKKEYLKTFMWIKENLAFIQEGKQGLGLPF